MFHSKSKFDSSKYNFGVGLSPPSILPTVVTKREIVCWYDDMLILLGENWGTKGWNELIT